VRAIGYPVEDDDLARDQGEDEVGRRELFWIA
jgi:hypothetical protein